MLMTTLGPTSWPITIGGRIRCFFLGLYAFTVLGYVTATLATFFIDRDADRPDAAVAGERSISPQCARRNVCHDVERSGTGEIPYVRRIRGIVERPTWCPRCSSAPWI